MYAMPRESEPKQLDIVEWERNMALNDKPLSKNQTRTLHECQICFLTFVKRESFKRHLDCFEDPKYECDKCDLKFEELDLFRTHVKAVHGPTIVRYKLRCPICDLEIRLERNFQSHLCHRHNGWENKIDTDLYVSESGLEITESESDIGEREIDPAAVANKSRKRYLKNLMKRIIASATNVIEGETISINGNKPKTSHINNNRRKSAVFIADKNIQPNQDSSESLRYRGDFKEFRRIRMIGKNVETGLSAGNESGSKNRFESSKVTRKKGSRRSRIHDSRRCRRDDALRKFYSCKDCFVPLSRIDVTNRTVMKVGTLDEVSRIILNQVEKCTSRGDDSKKYDKQDEKEKVKELKLMDVRVCLERLSSSGELSKSKSDDEQHSGLSKVVEKPLEQCSDGLGISWQLKPDYGYVDESSNFFSVPSTTEMINSVANEIFGQCDQSPSLEIKVEPMDCGVDDHSAVTRESLFYPEYPTVTDIMVKSETINVNPIVEPTNQLTIIPMECQGAILSKIEIGDNTYSGYSECGTDQASEPSEPSKIINTNVEETLTKIVQSVLSSTEKPQPRPPEIRMRIASRICDKTFNERRSLLRHAREKHLMCLGDTVYCTCGKEMIGRRALERHFSRHCGTIVEADDSTIDPSHPCNPLEKNLTCHKCGEKFWLETCLHDHPPNCEFRNPKTINYKSKTVTANPQNTNETEECSVDNGNYGCQICDVKFTNIGRLLRHERSFATNEAHRCTECRTIFPGSRLLKGHVQSTHELNSTLYTYFCDECNQGFTRKINKRIHMRHIHDIVPTEETVEIIEKSISPVKTSSSLVTPKISENQCDVCNLIFVNDKRYIDHMSYYDKTNGKRIACNICGESFEGQYRAHNHRKMVHYSGNVQNRYTYTCAICKEGFTYKTHLHAHMFHVHDKEFNCVTSVTNSVNEPKIYVQSSAVNEFPCTQCPQMFRTNSILIAHIFSYHGEDAITGRVKCTRCNQEFSTLSQWKIHFNDAHVPDSKDSMDFRLANEVEMLTESENVEISLSPSTSTGTFNPRTEKSQSVEKTNRTGGDEPKTAVNIGCFNDNGGVIDGINNENIRNTLCTTCGFDCPGPRELSKHEAIYVNSGTYACEFCGRRFRWQNFLRDHKLKHFRRDVQNKCFCPVCDEGFDNIRCLEMHTIHLHQRALRQLRVDTIVRSDSTPNHRVKKSSFENRSEIPKDQTIESEIRHSRSVKNNRCDGDVGDRFYVSLCDNIDSELVGSNENRIHEFDGALAITNDLYRYDDPWKCNLCNIKFATKNSLNNHNERFHTNQRNFQMVNSNADRQQTSSRMTTVSAPTDPTRNPGDTNIRSEPAPHHHSLQFEANEEPTIIGISRSITEPPSATNFTRSSKSPFNNQLIYHQCSVCDMFFSDENLLAVHEKNSHRLITSDICDRRSPFRATEDSNSDIVELPIDSEKVDIPSTELPIIHRVPSESIIQCVSVSPSPDEIIISDDQTQDTTELSSIQKNPPLTAIKKIRYINLPPGNYRISKLKVRTVNMATGIIMKNAIGTGNRPKY